MEKTKKFELSGWVHPLDLLSTAEDVKVLLDKLARTGMVNVIFQWKTKNQKILDYVAKGCANTGMKLWPWLNMKGLIKAGDENQMKVGRPALAKKEFGISFTTPCPSSILDGETDFSRLDDTLAKYRGAIEGIHMDYIRYFNACFFDYPCECMHCRKARKEWLGRELLTAKDLRTPSVVYKEIQMRCRAIRLFLTEIRKRVKKARLKVGIAARTFYTQWDDEMNHARGFGYGPAVAEGQDWQEWCQEGLLDRIDFMNYTTRFERFKEITQSHRRLIGSSKVKWSEGPCIRSSAGENSPEMVMKMIRYAKARGADGACIFAFNRDTDEAYIKALAEG